MNPNELREIRGFILGLLNIQPDHGLSTKVIELSLDQSRFCISPGLVRSEINYLKEKEYVRVEDVSSRGISRTLVYITTKGIDLLQGSGPADPGIIPVLE